MSAISDSMKGIGKARTSIMLTVAAAMIVAFIVLALHVSTGAMSPLYTGLSLEDSSKIIAELEKTGTPYELIANGSSILVPTERVLRMRMSMAEQGLPAGGSVVGYEIFDRSETFGSSSFVMNINMTRALEGELSRTIDSLTNVESARVHLVMPRREIFSRDKDKPSASVTVKLRGGNSLEKSEVNAITHLVASSVPGLEVSHVTVVDNHGRLLARGDGESGDASAGNAQEFKVAYETRVQQQLEDLIEKVIGAGKVRVQVAADMNFDRVVTNSEKYDPDGQVARSVQSTSEKENSQDKTAKENVSVANNLPPPSSNAEPAASSNHITEHADETTNYEISKTVQNHVSEGGNINKLSIAVLVDGTYSGDDAKNYTPRTEDELKQLKTLVTSAVGFDEKRGDKIEVVNMRFTQDSFKVGDESFYEKFKFEAQSIIKTLIIAVVAILAILLVLRPAVNQLIKQSQSPGQKISGELAALEASAGGRFAATSGGGGASNSSYNPLNIAASGPGDSDALIDVANISGGMRQSTMKKMIDIIDKYPDETMSVLRNWVTAKSSQ